MNKLGRWSRNRQGRWPQAWPVILFLIVVFVAVPVVRLSASTGEGSRWLMTGKVAAPAAVGRLAQAAPTATVDMQKQFLPLVSKNVPLKARNPFGVQLDGTEADQASKSVEVGAGWIRVIFRWYSVEPVNTTPEHYSWSPQFDEWLKQLSARGIHVILTLSGNPDWAATYDGGVLDKTDPGELAQFLSAAVARYSVPPYNVQYWEMYNEPDNGDESWADLGVGYWGNDPAAYAQMLATVYPRMKAANPNVQVVLGGLAYDLWAEDGGPFVKEFLDQILQYNAGSYFDVMNFHYYPNFYTRWAPYGIGLGGKTNFLRSKLASYGLDKPIICTETATQSGAFDGGSDEEQSRFLVQTFARGMGSDLDVVVWFTLVDQVGYWKSGLLNLDLTPKPSFFAYQTLADQLGTADFVRMMDPGELGATSIEAYAFVDPSTSMQILAAWSQDGLDHQVQIVAKQVTVVDKYGTETIHSDRDDGQVDNLVHVAVGPSPVYLRFAGDGQMSEGTVVVP